MSVFARPGTPSSRRWPLASKSEQKAIHQILLPHDNATNLLPKAWNPLAQLSYFLRNFLRRFHTVWSDTFGSENVRSNRD